jgi:hypothetical protein
MNIISKIVFAALLGFGSIASANYLQNAAGVAYEVQSLSDTVANEASLHLAGSPFERRLRNDAADFYRVAGRLADRAQRGEKVNVLLAEAKHLGNIVKRMENALGDAEVQMVRDPRRLGSARASTHHIHQLLQHMADDVARLRHDLEIARRGGYDFRAYQVDRVYVPSPAPYAYPQPPQEVLAPSRGVSIDTGRFSVRIGREF